ncbi:SusC/RagA family TonB-linked outer membrane protein [Sphingobacterium sp. Mn56C]|uniref:SusC/RagA family TonB-linked outer membrane protein n=1 Tax=Sphingobacterium sp. Mn56C TaxID=3395261 RepID=UPI003BC0C2BC
MQLIFNRSIKKLFFLSIAFVCSGITPGLAGIRLPDEVKLWTTKDSNSNNLDTVFRVNGGSINPVQIRHTSLLPIVSLQQQLKANNTGVMVTEQTGEPGTKQYLFFRGISRPLLSETEVYKNQPLIVLDGIPLVGEHPFAYTVQNYDLQRIGPATNLFNGINIDMIESIEVLKDVAATALYGPNAANGAIVIKSKPFKSNRTNRIALNAYTGYVQRPRVTTINGAFENSFRQQFYDLYTSNGKNDSGDQYPIYLSDSLNMDYYGNSNWSDLYYNDGFVYNVNANLSGGGPRANFQFAAGVTKDLGIAEQVKLNKYHATFGLNMKPIKWLTFSTMVNFNKIDRNRNKSLSERFAQMAYFPDLSAPLAPNKEIYSNYRSLYDRGFDNNRTNVIHGFGKLQMDFGDFHFVSSAMVDYNEGYRDQFYPELLMEKNSFVSNYYGFNQRAILENSAYYTWKLNTKNVINIYGGSTLQWETFRYNYAYAYKGINDFIKVNLLDGGLNPTAFQSALVFKYLDRTRHNLVSFFGKIGYAHDNKFEANVVLRSDGSSNAQPTHRWLFTPAISARWNITNTYLKDQKSVQELSARMSIGRIGIVNHFDDFAQGPNYISQIGFTGNQTIAGYNAISVLVRPYETGWIGYDIPWAYTDQVNLGFDFRGHKMGFFASLDLYLKESKNQIVNIPSFSEFGYRSSYKSGMDVQNRGFELTLGIDPIHKNNFKWSTRLNVSHNANKLKALPDGLQELVLHNTTKLVVGKSLDHFWLWKNEGKYNSIDEIPVVNGKRLQFNGIALSPGDPRWADINNDGTINDDDRILTGNKLPKFFGNWYNNFTYGKWDLGLNIYYNLGRKIINQEMSNRFDFINKEGARDIYAVKEITYWEKRGDYDKYPLYNPWSSVIPYQPNQDLFLEDGSFMKLRSASLGYNLTHLINGEVNNKYLSNAYVYVTASNIFTIASYTGVDPELVNYSGYDYGQNMRLPRIYSLGVKIDF